MLRLKQLWKSDKKLVDYIKELNPKKILIPFGHGLGDTIMFMNPFKALCEQFPDIEFTLAMQKGLGFEELENEFRWDNGKAICSSDLSYKEDTQEYDIIADIDFPMNEGQIEFTKGEWCCLKEIGIDPVSGHKYISCGKNKLIGVQFNITCLPDSANTPEPIAQKVWNEILESGNIPIETCMQHVFFNPVNKKYPFVNRDVREITAYVSTLAGLIQNCKAYITCVTGNFHLALSILPHDRICLLERDFKAGSFTKLPIKTIDVKNYVDGSIKDWLLNIYYGESSSSLCSFVTD